MPEVAVVFGWRLPEEPVLHQPVEDFADSARFELFEQGSSVY